MSIRKLLGLPVNTNLKAHRTYRIWCAMRSRVLHPWHHAFDKYQALGVDICPQWIGTQGFKTFLLDMGHPPSDKHTLERLNNLGGYCKENCMWVLPAQQNKNKSNLYYVDTPHGRICLAEVARLYGVTPRMLYYRYHRGERNLSNLLAKKGQKKGA